MPKYVDGFVIPVPRRNLAAYRRMAQDAARIWIENGAPEYRECVADDMDVPVRLAQARSLSHQHPTGELPRKFCLTGDLQKAATKKPRT